MRIDDWFSALQSELAVIDQEWEGAEWKRKEELAKKLLTLRQTSDQIIDLWLQFEENLSTVIKRIKSPAPTNPSMVKAATPKALHKQAQAMQAEPVTAPSEEVHLPENKAEKTKLRDQHLLFRKGEGFYHLRLFHDAVKCFADVVKESPDFESGRLYYAYSLLFSNQKEAAMREFRLLGKTASSPKIIAISCNALGCLLVEEMQWLEARQAFAEALKHVPDHSEARFNLALFHLQDGEAQEAIDTIDELLNHDEDDWEAHIIRYRAEMMLTNENHFPETVYHSSLPFDKYDMEASKILEMARVYDLSGQVDFARLCYKLLTEQTPLDGHGWHGLGYNVWLTSGAQEAVPLVKKAISLSPKNLDFLFTLGWMQLFEGESEKARQVFQFILLQEREHRLSQSGMITYYMINGEYQEAKSLAKRFTDESEPYVRALGYYHLGKVMMYEENWLLAKEYFEKASEMGNQFPELCMYKDICDLKMGISKKELFLGR